jgi:hypothetical protein
MWFKEFILFCRFKISQIRDLKKHGRAEEKMGNSNISQKET